MGKVNIQIVEDESIIAKDMQMTLQQLGYAVTAVVSSGELAVEKAGENRPDLVLMDIVLQGEMDGIEAAGQIRSQFDIPVIYLTAYSDEKTLERAKITEAFGYILKPFEERELHTAIEMAIYKHKMEKKLKESEEWISTILKSIGDAVIATDVDGCVKFMNPVAESLTGWKEADAMGKPLIEVYNIVCEETGKPIENPVEKVMREGIVVGLANHTLLLTQDGRKIPIDNSGAPIKDTKGNIIGVAMAFRDMTEKKEAEKKIKDARDFLNNIIESSMDGILIADVGGTIIDMNSTLEKMTGFAKEELIGERTSTLAVIKNEEEKERFLEKAGELIEKGSTSYEAIFKTKGDKGIAVECNTSMIKDEEGDCTAGVSIIRDISERKKMEVQLLQSEKLKSLGELSGGVAHDFNNVLAAILGRAQLLKMYTDPPPGKEEKRKSVTELNKGLEIIEKASLDGAETVRRIQEFSRRRTDDKHFIKVNVNELLDNAVEFTRAKWKDDAESKDIKIDIKKDFSDLPSIQGSASELREVFTNLINNAIDAMPTGGEIRIGSSINNSNIVITIEDTGSGILEAVRDKIFDPFFTTKGPQSSGLGMSVSYGIINRHRGNIRVNSVEGEGTTFNIILPIDVSGRSIEERKEESAPEKERKARILVIDDEEEVSQLLSDILTSKGHEVKTSPNGDQGIEMFKNDNFDLVFTDLGMPGLSGWQVAAEVKKIKANTPVTLITGWGIQVKDAELQKSGVDLVVAKPFKMDQIIGLVQKGMEIKERLYYRQTEQRRSS